MTGYSFSTPVWDGGTWVTPEVTTVTTTDPNPPLLELRGLCERCRA